VIVGHDSRMRFILTSCSRRARRCALVLDLQHDIEIHAGGPLTKRAKCLRSMCSAWFPPHPSSRAVVDHGQVPSLFPRWPPPGAAPRPHLLHGIQLVVESRRDTGMPVAPADWPGSRQLYCGRVLHHQAAADFCVQPLETVLKRSRLGLCRHRRAAVYLHLGVRSVPAGQGPGHVASSRNCARRCGVGE